MIWDVIATIIAVALNDFILVTFNPIFYHLSTMATAPAFSSLSANVDSVTCAVTQQPAFYHYVDARP